VPEDRILEADIQRMKRGFDLYNAGDYQALREFMSPDVVIERVGGLPPIHGFDELVALQEPDAFEYQRLHAIDWAISGDKGLVRVRIHAKGAGSGVELDVEGWQVYTLRDGMVVRMQNFLDEADARAAAGL
jgi:ketosteroid isomerase-like protein